MRRGLELARERARQLGTCTVVIRRSHHIACLAAYLRPVADEGLMVLLACSDPTAAGVAPHGGSEPGDHAESAGDGLARRRAASR